MVKRKRTNNDLQSITQKDRQYNGQKKKNKQWSTKHYTEGQTIQWSKDKEQTMSYKALHRRTDNTMVKRQRTNNDLQNITQKERQYNGQKTKNKQWSTKHYTEGQTIQWSKDKEQTMIYKTLHRRRDNTMVKRQRTNNDLQNIRQKDRQYNGQKTKNKQWATKHYTEGQTIQWSKDKEQTMIYKTLHRRKDNTMVKRQRTKKTNQWLTKHCTKDWATRTPQKILETY